MTPSIRTFHCTSAFNYGSAHVRALDAEQAAESYVEQMAYDLEVKPGDTVRVAVADGESAAQEFDVELEVAPRATAKPVKP